MNQLSEETTPGQSKAQKLLVIDDDLKFCRLLVEYLEKHGFSVTTAYSGDSAVRLIDTETWDAIILDVMMPGMDGYEVLRRMRDQLETPVLMLTALGSDETERIVGLEIGADDYLPKTCSPRELLAHIRALLRRANKAAQAPLAAKEPDLVFGPLTIKQQKRTALLRDEPLALTPVEFDLLLVLARAKGRIKSREQLLNEIRNRNFDIYDRSIDVHISSLRRKLKDDLRKPRFIKTVRSAGYMFIDQPEEST
jgi:DNA-binding response OmpR family regulator